MGILGFWACLTFVVFKCYRRYVYIVYVIYTHDFCLPYWNSSTNGFLSNVFPSVPPIDWVCHTCFLWAMLFRPRWFDMTTNTQDTWRRWSLHNHGNSNDPSIVGSVDHRCNLSWFLLVGSPIIFSPNNVFVGCRTWLDPGLWAIPCQNFWVAGWMIYCLLQGKV